MNIDEKIFQQVNKLSVLRSVIILIIVSLLLFFYYEPIDYESGLYIIVLLSLVYLIMSVRYFYYQIKLWENINRYRFLAWYYISFSVVEIFVMLASTVVSVFLFDNVYVAVLTFVLFLTKTLELFLTYRYSLHFISVYPDGIWVVKKKIRRIFPSDVAEIHYRNDILIFKLLNEKTVFINFLEVNNAQEVRKLLAEWIIKNAFDEYNEIAEELMKQGR